MDERIMTALYNMKKKKKPVNALAVTSVAPNSGSTAGGETVAIKGNGFRGGATVKFGSVEATGVATIDAFTMTCVTPAHVAGAVNVFIVQEGVTVLLTNGFTYA